MTDYDIHKINQDYELKFTTKDLETFIEFARLLEKFDSWLGE